VNIGTEADVIGEIPTRIVRIGVENDVVGIPEPAVAEGNVSGSDAEVVTAEPEA
jgi:hypothetical protein